MLPAMSIALSAQKSISASIEATANNLANASTVGFRASQAVHRSVNGRGILADTSLSVVETSLASRESGGHTKTDNPFDVALNGDAWLGVQTPQGRGYTRDGRLRLAQSGLIETVDGFRVLDTGGSAIVIEPGGRAPEILPNGAITQSGTPVGSLGLFSLGDARDVKHLTPLVFRSESASLIDVNGRESVSQGFLESSNVNSMSEMTRLMSAQRLFESVSSLMETCESTYGEAIRTLGAK